MVAGSRGQDLPALVLLGIVTPLVAFLTDGGARVVPGLALALFASGYSVIGALYVDRTRLQWGERVALSVGTSLLLLVLLGFALNFTPWSTNAVAITGALGAVTVLAALVAWLRRASIMPAAVFAPALHLDRGAASWRAIALAIAAAALIGLSATYSLSRRSPSDSFTAFYVLGPDGSTSGYPRDVRVGTRLHFILGVHNREDRRMRYRIDVSQSATPVARLETEALPPGAHWRHVIQYRVRVPGNLVLAFHLVRRDEPHRVYRSLTLRMNVHHGP